MAKKAKETVVVTRAEKKDATKNLIREVLAVKPQKHNELLDEVAKLYAERFGSEETENVNDVKGRVGSVLDIMKKDGDVMQDNGAYALKARVIEAPVQEEKPVKKTTRSRVKKAETEAASTEEKAEEKPTKKTARKSKKTEEQPLPQEETKEEKPKKTRAKKTVKSEEPKEEKQDEKAEPLPAGPIQPIAPVVPVTPETAPEPIPEKEEKKVKKTTKTRAKKTAETIEEKAEEKAEEKVPETKEEEGKDLPVEAKKEEKPEIKNPPVVKEKAEVVKQPVVMDMSFLFGGVKQPKAEQKAEPKTEQKPSEKAIEKKAEPLEQKTEQKPVQKVEESKPAPVKEEKRSVQPRKEVRIVKTVKKVTKPLTAEEKLKEAFLKKLRSLGGDYFEYYSVYLLERYSMKNGRRLEGLRISGGDHDGGIDGEIELTDKFGFRETIYIQSKNWDPDKGDERLWVVGETLLQQFIGACACKQAKDKKQHCRGIFVTTSRFTPDAKHILEDMSDKIVGYDGNDLFEAAKECEFGVVKKNGEWTLDEKLLSGTKAFFNLL